MVSHVGKVDIDLRPFCLVPHGGWVNELFFLRIEDNYPRPKQDQRGNQNLMLREAQIFCDFFGFYDRKMLK